MWKCKSVLIYRDCVDIYIQDRESKYGGYSGVAIMVNSINTQFTYIYRRGNGLAINMLGQHVCVLRVRVPLLPPPCGYSGI
jgi:hypothetical protein